jgi:hypothetical protein
MPDQHELVTRLLAKMGLGEKWHVFEPAPGDVRDMVWIQNPEERLKAFIEISPQDAQLLHDDDEMLRRIRVGMANAEKI